jgi:RNA polymerase sigma-70 factor (ECF subfamily)
VLSSQQKDSPRAGIALETLCRTYWYPLYAFVRRQGRSPEDAQDLTQEFFARLLEKDYLQAVVREKGKFRSFLLMALKRFLMNDWKQARAQKRGGGCVTISLEASQLAETRYLTESVAPLTAEKLYERRWALTLLDRAQMVKMCMRPQRYPALSPALRVTRRAGGCD